MTIYPPWSFCSSFSCHQGTVAEGLLLLTQYNMEVVGGHSSSLLVNLNIQRQRAEFCDCVVRQRENPAQLFPAHRCVLAASSPVLASILSSTGALVELQAPSLSGSVLALLLDYIYTGTLQSTRIQHHYYSLLTTANYLQMDELQEALGAWQQPELSHVDKTNRSDSDHSVQGIAQPITWNVDVCPRHEEKARKLKREDRVYSYEEVNPESVDPCVIVWNGANCCRSTLNVSSCSSASEDSGDSVIVSKCKAVTYLTDEVHRVSNVDEDLPRDRFLPAGAVNPPAWQRNTETEVVRTVGHERNSSSPSSSSSPHLCCELVPVIRHSSRAAEPSQHRSGSKTPVNFSSNSVLPQSAGLDIHNIAESVITTHSVHDGDPTDRNSTYQTWRWDSQTSLDHPSQDQRAADPLPVEMSDIGSNLYGEAQEEHTYSSQDSASGDLLRIHKAETTTRNTTCGQQRDRGECEESGRLFDYELSEQHMSFKVPEDGSMADPSCGLVGEPYQGHIHYQHLPNEATHSDPNPSHNQTSSDGEEEVMVGQASLSPTDRSVLLLDISGKSAELLVSYKQRTEEEADGERIKFCQNGRFGAGLREQEARCAKQTNEGRTSVREVQSLPGAHGLLKAEVMEEDFSPEEHESQSSTLRSPSPPPVPDCVPASISSSWPVCAPSTLSSSMPRNISGRLSTPLHQPFQCSLCERSFSQRGSLNRHVRSHLGVRPFPCPCCPMTFSRQYRVTEHMRVHQRCTQVNHFHKPQASSSRGGGFTRTEG